MEYTFLRRTTNLPDGVDRKKTFNCSCYLEALQEASNYWFNGAEVVDWQTDSNVVTLLSNSKNGNVIGTVVDY